MTIEEAQTRLNKIRECRGDDEAAHGYEDDLYYDFIKWIATGDEPDASVARLILTSKEIDFERWCA